MFVRVFYLLLFLLSVTVLSQRFAYALDKRLTWVSSTTNCSEFLKKTEEFVASLPKVDQASEGDDIAISELLEAACRPDLAQCKFSICAQASSEAVTEDAKPARDDDSQESGDHDQGATDVAASSEPMTNTDDRNASREIERRTNDATNTIDGMPRWLSHQWSCSELEEQFKARFLPFGGFFNYPPIVRSELIAAAKYVCEGNYQHCGFAHCKDFSNVKMAPGQINKDVDLGADVFDIPGLSPRMLSELIGRGSGSRVALDITPPLQVPIVKMSFAGLTREAAMGQLYSMLKARQAKIEEQRKVEMKKLQRASSGYGWVQFSIPSDNSEPTQSGRKDDRDRKRSKEKVWYSVEGQ